MGWRTDNNYDLQRERGERAAWQALPFRAKLRWRVIQALILGWLILVIYLAFFGPH